MNYFELIVTGLSNETLLIADDLTDTFLGLYLIVRWYYF